MMFMASNKISWPMRFGAYVMLFIALGVWPASWHLAYAQGLPELSPQRDVDTSWLVSQLSGQDPEQELINKRAARLLRGDPSQEIIRAPKIDSIQDDVRVPNADKAPDEKTLAEQQAARVPQFSQTDIVQGAQRGSNAAQGFTNKVENISLDTKRVDPEVNQTTKGRVNITEMMPGFNAKNSKDIESIGSAVYSNPEILQGLSEQNKNNIRRTGCRKTEFIPQELQNIDLAANSPNHRILKVEFFDIEKQEIPGTNPIQYQSVMKPSTYKRGKVDMQVATLGGSATVYWDRVDETFAIKYTYTPFSSPKGRNYFTYNHWFAVDRGAGIERLNDPGLVSYGSPSDGWKPVATKYIQPGVAAAYLSADLYQAQATFTKEIPGQPCPSDPPPVCEVPAVGGGTIRWCPGAYGSNIALMYDDQANPDERRVGKKYNDMSSNNAGKKDYTTDTALRTGVLRGVNANSSAKAQELAGTCRRDPVSSIILNKGKPYNVPDIHICSNALVNPYPKGCKNIKRSFGLVYLGEHNYLTVRAYKKVKVPIIDPWTGKQSKDKDGNLLYTYRKEPANVNGPIRTDFAIMGGPQCPGDKGCTTEKLPDDPLGSSEGYYVEYTHDPMPGQYKDYAFDGVYIQGGGTSNFTNYGSPEKGWLPTGTASGDGSLQQVRLMAKAYTVPINTFAGCENYMAYVADGFCQGGKLKCVDGGSTRTVGGVTFGPNLPNSGIVDLLKKWGTDASAVHNDINNGNGDEPTPNGPPVVLLNDPMCWEAEGESFTGCASIGNGNNLRKYFNQIGEEWVTDCNVITDDNNIPLENSPSCQRSHKNDGCDTRFKGLFTGACYNQNLAYDCGKVVNSNLPIVVEEQGDSCSGVMRCMGTECHKPNLSGNHGEGFAQAASSMEALNFMINEMVCAETGEPPKSASETCSPVVFGGKPMYCKLPIGREVGLAPDCCKEAEEGAKSAPSWIEYVNATRALLKIARTETVQNFMSGFDVYNKTAQTFGEISKPFTDAYTAASDWLTTNVVEPFSAGFDNMFGSFLGSGAPASGSTSVIANVPVDAVPKQGMIDGAISQLKQKLMDSAYELLNSISPDLANSLFTMTPAGATFAPAVKEILGNINTVFMVYSIARLIGHIIFACKQEEYEWGMNSKWRLCTFVDSCCSKKILFVGCVETRRLYCCYKSIVSRIMSEQIIKQNLTGGRQFGYRTAANGRSLGGCSINCGGFSAMELASVDWSRVDLTEWTDVMVQSGAINPADPRTSYGVTKDTVSITKNVGNAEDTKGQFDQRSAAFKTIKGWESNVDTLSDFTTTLREDGQEHCVDPKDDKKMPFTYPGCKKVPSQP